MSSPSVATWNEKAETLGRDARGAILVPAIVMGALLTGALFYVAAVGDAIIFRTQLQDAADTTAFTSAVWHAKGMNIVAVINILMSLVLCVIVLFHVLEVICLIIALIPGVGGAAMGIFRSLLQLEQRVSRGVGAALHALKTTQEGVVVIMPYVAAFEAKRTPTAADTIWPGSLALLPVPIDRALGQEMPRMPHNAPAALPVQEADFGVLCARATGVIPEQILELIDSWDPHLPGPIGGWVKDGLRTAWDKIKTPIDAAAEAGDGLLCQPVNNLIAKLADMVVGAVSRTAGSDACGAEADQHEREEQASADAEASRPNADGSARPAPPPPTETERRERQRRRRARLDECEGAVSQLSRGTDISVPPASVWTAAANGNAFLHTWSRAQGTPRMFRGDVALVSMAGNGASANVTPSTTAWAEAEYYVDCSDVWSSCQDDALWAPNWTARMRRFRWPHQELAKMGQDAVLNLGTVMQDVALEQGQELLANLIGRRTGDWAGEAIAELVMGKVQEWEPLKSLAERANQAIANGASAAGLSDLLNARNDDERRVH